MKSKKIMIIIIVLSIAVALTVVFMKKNKEKEDVKKFDMTMDEIIDVLSYVPHSLVTLGEYKDAYVGEKVLVQDIPTMILASVMIGRYYESYTAKNGNSVEYQNIIKKYDAAGSLMFLISEVDDFLMSHYNIKLSDLDISNTDITVMNINDTYLSFSQMKTVDTSLLYEILVGVDDVAVNEEETVITERKLFVTFSDNKYFVYETSNIGDQGLAVKTYDGVDKKGKVIDFKVINKLIKEDFKDYKTLFKHTFKKNDTGYYWYSSELIK